MNALSLTFSSSRYQNGAWIETVDFFNPADKEERSNFIATISNHLEQVAYPPLDTIIRAGADADLFYVVQQGLVGYKGRVMREGKVCRG